MAWQKVPQEHVELLDRAMESVPDAQRRTMFGCPVWFLNGHMLAGAHQESIFLRLSPEDQEELWKVPGVALFSPMPGRVMRDYLVLPPSITGSPEELRRWLRRASDHTRSLAPKPPKPPRPKRGRSAP